MVPREKGNYIISIQMVIEYIVSLVSKYTWVYNCLKAKQSLMPIVQSVLSGKPILNTVPFR